MPDQLTVLKNDVITAYELFNNVLCGYKKYKITKAATQSRLTVYHTVLSEHNIQSDMYVCARICFDRKFECMTDDELKEFIFMAEDIAQYYKANKAIIDAEIEIPCHDDVKFKMALVTRAEIKARCEALEIENMKLAAKLASTKPQKLQNSTTQATAAASSARVNEWKEYARAFVKIAIFCMKNKKINLTRAELEAVCKDCDVELSGTAFDELRKALPSEFVRTTPGAPKSPE